MKQPDLTPATVPVINGDIIRWGNRITDAMFRVLKWQKVRQTVAPTVRPTRQDHF